ncbi:MAG: hypothetical protein JJ916_06115 [Phycisphaerales bacterium]|nr:hypothetical protein [Phycisphaerales bacterium]
MTPDLNASMEKLLKSLRKKHGSDGGVSAAELFPDERLIDEPLINEMVVSMLLWESTVAHAEKGVERIRSELVDLNELRVCTLDELIGVLGSRMPRCSERALRMITVLNTIYDRENALTLAPLREMNKKEVLGYLGSIDGLPCYAASRVVLLGLELHAFPLDERIAKKLAGEEIIGTGMPLEQQAAQLERGVRATDAMETYTLIEHWAQGARSGSRRKKSGESTVKGASS